MSSRRTLSTAGTRRMTGGGHTGGTRPGGHRLRWSARALAVAAVAALTAACGSAADTSATSATDATTAVSSATTASTSASATTDSTAATTPSTTAETSAAVAESTAVTTSTTAATVSSTPDPGAGIATPSSESVPATVDPADVTPPGTSLGYGAAAILPVPVGDGQHSEYVRFSEVGLTPGTADDWAALGATDPNETDGLVPWYLRTKVTLLTAGPLPYAPDQLLVAILGNGEAAYGDVPVDQENPRCPTAYVDDTFSTGATYTQCVVLSVPQDQTIALVQFGGDFQPGPYQDQPVVWK